MVNNTSKYTDKAITENNISSIMKEHLVLSESSIRNINIKFNDYTEWKLYTDIRFFYKDSYPALQFT